MTYADVYNMLVGLETKLLEIDNKECNVQVGRVTNVGFYRPIGKGIFSIAAKKAGRGTECDLSNVTLIQ